MTFSALRGSWLLNSWRAALPPAVFSTKNRIVDDMDKAQLAAMEKAPLGYAAKIRAKIETLLEAHYRETFDKWLETERIVCKPLIPPAHVYSPGQPYRHLRPFAVYGGGRRYE